MDKFQKALNKIVKSCCPNCIDENGCSSCDIEKVCNATAKSWVDTLQELIDKATPKKTIKKPIIRDRYRQYKNYCPVCNQELLILGNYCLFCGQNVDFGE